VDERRDANEDKYGAIKRLSKAGAYKDMYTGMHTTGT
jgi:hypothetical protein